MTKIIADAITKGVAEKIKTCQVRTKVEIARYFGIAGPSLHNWMDTGRVSRDKMPRLMGYFKDVTTPEDWGYEDWPSWVETPDPEDLAVAAQGAAPSSRLARKADDLLHGLQDLLRSQAPVDPEEQQLLTMFRRLSGAQRTHVLVLINAMQK